MPGTTDTRKAEIPTGSFIMNYQSSRMYPQLEPLARKYSADKKDMANSQNVILTNGEIYFPPDAVEAIGVEKLEYMNNKSKGGAHDAIDNEIAMNLLKSIKPMYGGGMVNPSMKPMVGGGMVQQYGHGGMVNKYEDGGQAMSNLKPVPDNKPGLAKLPEDVRNKMGYMQEGGMAYIDPADSSIVVMNPEQSKMFDKFTTNTNFAPETSKKYMLETIIDALNNPEYYGLNKKDTLKNNNMIPKSIKAPDSTPNSLMGMMGGGMAKKKKMMGYEDGGPVEEGIPLPPQPMDPLQIGARQADPSMYEGSTLGAMRDQAMMLQDSIEQDTVNKARNSLKLMALIDSLKQAGAGESVDYMPMNPMPPTRADSMRVRDLMEFLNMQQMQRVPK
tara:strand:- start:916 stop:2076 length:1161 start_codon:yes stop_codon:yes gene_type:complete